MGFRLVPKSVTLNDVGLMACSLRYFAEFGSFRGLLRTRCSAIAERPHCRVSYSFSQKWKTGTERQYFADIVEFGKKRQIRAITAFKGIQGHRGRYQSKACLRLPISD